MMYAAPRSAPIRFTVFPRRSYSRVDVVEIEGQIAPLGRRRQIHADASRHDVDEILADLLQPPLRHVLHADPPPHQQHHRRRPPDDPEHRQQRPPPVGAHGVEGLAERGEEHVEIVDLRREA